MNIHTTLGLVEGWASDWLGPNALWRSSRRGSGHRTIPATS